MVTFFRRWWPVPMLIAAAWVLDFLLFRARYGDAVGHAAGHLASAAALFPGLLVLSIILWATPRARRQPDVWMAGAAWIAALIGVMVGNVRVVDAIGTRDWGNDEVARLGAGLPGFSSGHDLAELASYFGVAATIVLAIVLLARHHVSPRAAVGAIALSVVFPAWITPGAGGYVLAVALCLARRRRLDAGHHLGRGVDPAT